MQSRSQMSIAEQILKAENPVRYEKFKDKDGWTEIVPINKLNALISLIKTNNYFNTYSLKYTELPLTEKRNKAPRKRKSSFIKKNKKKAIYYNIEFIDKVNSFFSVLDNLLNTNSILGYKLINNNDLFLLLKSEKTDKRPNLRYSIGFQDKESSGFYNLGAITYFTYKNGNILYHIETPYQHIKKHQKTHFRNFKNRFELLLFRIEKSVDNNVKFINDLCKTAPLGKS